MKNLEVNYAVIPCAGRGTRFLPITKGSSKEMLNIIDRPSVDYIVDECVDSGITNIVFIISEGKDDLIKYYTPNKELEDDLLSKGKEEYVETLRKIQSKATYHFVYQKELLGLGHAVLQAKEIIKDNNFVVCCGDDVNTYKKDAPLKQLIEAFKETNGSIIVGGQKIEGKDISKYGCMNPKTYVRDDLVLLKDIVEKPKFEEAPSNLASLGKWVFTKDIFDYLEKTPLGKGGEIQLTDAIALAIKDKDVYYKSYEGKRYDCGDKLGYLKAIVDFALEREEFKKDFYNYLKSKVNK